MPGFTMHYLFGITSMQELHNDFLKSKINKHKGVFALGTQGPDLFFYDFLSNFLYEQNPGSIIHKENIKLFFRNFIHNVDKMSEEAKEIGICYLCGFLAHYSLDQYCHPYVYARTAYMGREKGYLGRHIAFESQMDIEILKRLKNCRPSEFKQSRTMKMSLYEKKIIGNILYETFVQTYPNKKLHPTTTLRAIFMILWFSCILRDKKGWKKLLISKIERTVVGYEMVASLIETDKMDTPIMKKKDVLNIEKKTWKNPWDTSIVSDESVIELWDKSKRTYRERMKSLECFFQSCGKEEESKLLSILMNDIANISYHTGFPCTFSEILKKY